MQILFEASKHITQEIERTRQHLTNLEQALGSLKSLVTIDAATATAPYTTSPVESVEDLSVVNAEVPVQKAVKSKLTAKDKKAKAKTETKEVPIEVIPEPVVKLPSTGAELWLKCIGRKKVSVNQIADAALAKLKLDDSARPVIATRAKAWVYAAAKKGDLIAAGTRDGQKLYQLAPAKVEKVAESVEAVEGTQAAETAPVSKAAEVVSVAEGSEAT